MSRRALYALYAFFGLVAAGGALWALTFVSPWGDSLDEATMRGFVGLRSDSSREVAHELAAMAHPQPFIWFGLGLMIVALVRGLPRLALFVPFVLGGSALTTQILKPALADPRIASFLGDAQVNAASWPSGHATAAMALALCMIVVAPPRWRPVAAAFGAVFALGVSFSIILLIWHYPSDVLAGFLVAASWTAFGLALLWEAEERWPARSGRAAATRARESLSAVEVLAPTGLAVAAASLAAGVLVLATPDRVLDYAETHTKFVVVSFAIATLSTMLASGLALVLRR